MLLCPTIVWGLQFRECKRRGDFKFCFFAPSKHENTQNTNQKQGHGGESGHFKSSTREQNLQQFLRSCFLSHQDSRWVAQRRRFSYSGKPISNASGGFGNRWVFPFLFWKLKLWWGHLFPTFLSLRYHNIFTKKSDQIPNEKRDSSGRLKGKINFNAFASGQKMSKHQKSMKQKTTWGSQKPQVVSEMHPVVVEVPSGCASFSSYNFKFSQGCPTVNLKGGSRVNKQRWTKT